MYEGEWVNGKQDGKGVYIFPNGEKKYGLWKDGKRINLQNDESEESND